MSERTKQESGSAAPGSRGIGKRFQGGSSPEARLRGSFDTQDVNRDGRLTLGEFIRFMSNTDLQLSSGESQIAFDEIDTDHDGLIDFAQLLVWYNERLIPPESP